MLELNELQRLAELASVLPWEKSPSDVPYAHKKQFQDAMDPDTAKKLIAVAQAAGRVLRQIDDGEVLPWFSSATDLRTALEELKGKT